MKYIVTLNGKEYEVEVTAGTAEIKSVSAPGAAPTPKAAPAVAAPKAPAPAPAPKAAAGETTVSAPMPGNIFKVMKNVGDTVKSGDVLIILEAMKMENEIYAPCAGVVKQVATNGATVNTGDMLTVIG